MSPSHVVPLRRPSDGLFSRLALVDAAERTLDVQYYLWDSDAVGYLLLSRLIAAADRGVVVRVLVDDMKFRRRTHSIAALCLHPNMEIRVFNPWSKRSSAAMQGLESVRRFVKLNQRMHNKLLIADDERAIFGGRNIAVDHFGLGTVFNLIDYDLQLTGTGVSDLSDAFDTYWDGPTSVAGSAFDQTVSEVDLTATRNLVAAELDRRTSTLSSVLAERDAWDQRVDSTAISVSESSVSVVSDAPGGSQDTQPTQVIDALRRAVDNAERDLLVVTPFFVPNEIDVEWYGRLVDRGVRIRILTNSLASNQGTISNSGLNRQRLAVVNAGVELHELRTDARAKPQWETPPQVSRYLGLHAKLYAIDGQRVFVGSVNLDPRSKFINTEIGVAIENVELTERTVDVFAGLMTTENAWRVEIGPDNRLLWRNDTETSRRQPARSAGQRLADKLLALLPIRDYI